VHYFTLEIFIDAHHLRRGPVFILVSCTLQGCTLFVSR